MKHKRLNRFVKFLAAVALLTPLAGPVAAADAALEAMVVKGFETCLANRTKTARAGEALKKDGWQSKGQVGNIRLYFSNGFKAVATTTPAFAKDNLCGFGIKDMNQDGAIRLADKIMRNHFGKAVERVPPNEIGKGAVAVWGAKKGSEITVAVVDREVNYSPYYRGSLIYFVFGTE